MNHKTFIYAMDDTIDTWSRHKITNTHAYHQYRLKTYFYNIIWSYQVLLLKSILTVMDLSCVSLPTLKMDYKIVIIRWGFILKGYDREQPKWWPFPCELRKGVLPPRTLDKVCVLDLNSFGHHIHLGERAVNHEVFHSFWVNPAWVMWPSPVRQVIGCEHLPLQYQWSERNTGTSAQRGPSIFLSYGMASMCPENWRP